jgi:hypothetical protein
MGILNERVTTQMQGYLRNISKFYQETIIIGKEGHEILYRDFCSSYVTQLKSYGEAVHISPKDLEVFYDVRNPANNRNFDKQIFIPFGKKIYKMYDILVHVRNEPLKEDGIYRNFGSLEDFEALLSNFKDKKIATVGTSKSLYVKGTDDLRNMPLALLADVMANSKMIVGALSGPIHFASLCRCPQITWSTVKENERRCLIDWNPFNTDVHFSISNNIPKNIDQKINQLCL